jgi:hypothetical protein
MRVVRWALVAVIAAAGLTLTGVALGVGPWPGLAPAVVSTNGHVAYSASRSASSTIVRARTLGNSAHVLTTVTFDGRWGIPAVTSTGRAGGLSPDGRLLVLSEPPSYNGLRTESKFLLLSTRALKLRHAITLRGEFGFDALSADGRTLYVIQHQSAEDLVSYVVRGYDLTTNRLIKGAIVAKGESSTMRGYPVSRAVGSAGTWVYTLYHRENGKPFIHSLNTDQRYAICIDLPWQATFQTVWSARLALSPTGNRLLVRSDGKVVARVDTKTFRVLKGA